MKLKVRVELSIQMECAEELDSDQEIYHLVQQELCDMLYVGATPDSDDIFSVEDLHIRFMKVENMDRPSFLNDHIPSFTKPVSDIVDGMSYTFEFPGGQSAVVHTSYYDTDHWDAQGYIAKETRHITNASAEEICKFLDNIAACDIL